MTEKKPEAPTKPKKLTEPDTPQAQSGAVDSPPPPKEAESAAPPKKKAPTVEELAKRFGNRVARPPTKTRYQKQLIYGPAGVGKTTYGGSSQECKRTRDVLVLDIEDGALSLSDHPDIDVVQITAYDQFARMADFLRLYAKARDAKDKRRMVLLEQALKVGREDYDPEAIEKSPKVYRSVMIDSLSEAQKLVMYQLMGVNLATSALDDEPEMAEFKQWGQGAEMVRLLVRTFRSLPYNVFFVCGLSEKEDDRKKVHHLPSLPGKLAHEIHGFVDVVGYMASRKKTEDDKSVLERRMYLQPTDWFQAKDRYHTGNTVKYLTNPTVESFLRAGEDTDT